jgi:tripartite-type tricarboxylate transporter receptor subunit TctC
MSVNPILTPDMNVDPVKDFQPITPIISFPHILVVPPDSPVKTVADLVALAKTKPGGLSFGSQGVGSGGQILGEVFKNRLGVPMVHVPYRGAAPDRHHGRPPRFPIHVLHLGWRAGQGRQAPRHRHRNAVPDIPTVAEAGYPELSLLMWHGMVAPAGLPAPIVMRLNAEFAKAARSPEIQQIIAPQATDLMLTSPQEFSAMIAADTERLGKVIRDAGIKVK